MRYLIDVDGVCADFVNHLLGEINSKLSAEDVVDWNIFDYFDEEEERCARRALAHPDFWSNIPAIGGARPVVEELRRRGHQVYFVTSPYWSCREWGTVRLEWLAKHFMADPRDVVIATRKYLVGGDVFIDDKPENVERWRAQHRGKLGVIFDQPYNKHVPGPRMFRWGSFFHDFVSDSCSGSPKAPS